MQYTARYRSPMGEILLAADGTGLTGLWFEGAKYYAGGLDPEHEERELPYGETVTYGELAQAVAGQRGLARMSAQAVGGAVGHNPISLIVPCHRVVGADGSLTGYAGGVAKKERLLALEGVDMGKLFLPAKGTAL